VIILSVQLSLTVAEADALDALLKNGIDHYPNPFYSIFSRIRDKLSKHEYSKRYMKV